MTMPDDDILSLESFLPYRLNRLAEAVSRKFSANYKARYGLTRPEWRTLATLGQFSVMSATEIAQHSSMHKTKVSRAVAELERRKWLKRTPDANDRRLEHLSLTPSGIKAYRDLLPIAREFESRFLDDLNTQEKQGILQALTLLERAAGLSERRP